MNLRILEPLMTLCAGLLLSACVVVPARHATGYPGDYPSGGHASGGDYPSSGVYVDVPPPAPRYEVVPVAPFLGAIWISGFWNWHGGRHAWTPGRWERPHQHGRAWVPHRWSRTPRGWHLDGGRWR